MKAELAKKPNQMGWEITGRSSPAGIMKKIQVQLVVLVYKVLVCSNLTFQITRKSWKIEFNTGQRRN